jgi:hypothetical protein
VSEKEPDPSRVKQPITSSFYGETVRALARAFAAGEDCGFALCDALLEQGRVADAEHFRPHDGGPACLPGEYCLVIADILEPLDLPGEEP